MDKYQIFGDQQRSAVDVLLITMPFGPIRKPSIGLSLLQAGLHKVSISSKILYFTLLFAKRIGIEPYEQVADGPYASTGQIGEWVFSSALFSKQDSNSYLETILFADDPCQQQESAVRKAEMEVLGKHLLMLRDQVDSFVDQCLAIVLQYQPKIIGFTSTFQQQLASLALAKRIKDHFPQTYVVFGGANVEGIMGVELVRQFPFVDVVVSGQGDIVFPDVVTKILRGRSIHDIPGVYTHQNIDLIGTGDNIPSASSVYNMDSLPYPDYDEFFIQKSELALDFSVYLLYETSRGCWWGMKNHCTFCGLNGLTMNFHGKSPDRALQELVYLAERYPGYPIAAVDNILDMKYFKTFIPAIAELGLDLELFYEVKANLKKEQLQLLRQANIRRIQPGIESISTPVLRMMRKGVRALQNVQLLKWCEELGINLTWNFLWGFPGEPPEEYAYIAQLLPVLSHLTPPDEGGQVRLDRFSPLFVEAEEYGLKQVRPYSCYQYIYVGIPEHSLANLAYYFTFEHQDDRDVPSYTQGVVQAINVWKQDHERSFLYLIQSEKEAFIWDLRPIAPRMITRLTGLERDLYLACDVIQGLDSLIQIAKSYLAVITQLNLEQWGSKIAEILPDPLEGVRVRS